MLKKSQLLNISRDIYLVYLPSDFRRLLVVHDFKLFSAAMKSYYLTADKNIRIVAV